MKILRSGYITYTFKKTPPPHTPPCTHKYTGDSDTCWLANSQHKVSQIYGEWGSYSSDKLGIAFEATWVRETRLSLVCSWPAGATVISVGGLWATRGIALCAGLLHKAEGFQELIDVDVAILVEVNAPGKVTDTVICDVNLHVRAEQLPSLPELVQWDEPLPERGSHFS